MYHTTREIDEEPERKKKKTHIHKYIYRERETKKERLTVITAWWHCIQALLCKLLL
jgi:hypothetical protein